jgi:hypothetical protein
VRKRGQKTVGLGRKRVGNGESAMDEAGRGEFCMEEGEEKSREWRQSKE